MRDDNEGEISLVSINSWFGSLRRRVSQRRRLRFRSAYEAAISDISLRLQYQATVETAEYVNKRMPFVDPVNSWRAVHDLAIKAANLDGGDVLEFGVFSGTTVNYIANQSGWKVAAFDSFDGLPEPWRAGYQTGKFSRSTLPKVAESVTLYVGWFDQTLPKYVAERGVEAQPVRYLHIDSDLYSSAKTIFQYLGDRIVDGTVIVFDEYFNYSGWQGGEYKAFQEFVEETGVDYEYLTYNSQHQQVAVKIRSKDSDA